MADLEEVPMDVYAASAEELEIARAKLEDPITFGDATARSVAKLNFQPAPGTEATAGDAPGTAGSPAPDGRAGGTTFRAPVYFSHLRSRSVGRTLFHAPRVSSTQTFVQAAVGRLPDGSAAVADVQVGGRGRGGNVWESPPGCLMMTAVRTLRGLPGDRVAFVQYIASLAVLDAVAEAASERLPPHALAPDLRIKWPNDLYLGGLKVGGVLCHSAYGSGAFRLVVGIGLNLDNEAPTTSINASIRHAYRAALAEGVGGAGGDGRGRGEGDWGSAVPGQDGRPGGSWADASPEPTDPAEAAGVSRERLLAALLSKLDEYLDTLTSVGWQPFAARYQQKWLHSRQRLIVKDGHERGADAEVVVIGLSERGYLLAADVLTKAPFELHPDGNSLDFLQGLIRKKPPTAP